MQPYKIFREQVEALGFDLEVAVRDHFEALHEHARTVGVPAPVAHPVVEAIVRQHGARFEILDAPPLPLPFQPAPPPVDPATVLLTDLYHRMSDDEDAAFDALAKEFWGARQWKVIDQQGYFAAFGEAYEAFVQAFGDKVGMGRARELLAPSNRLPPPLPASLTRRTE